jgi:hypothetical protein
VKISKEGIETATHFVPMKAIIVILATVLGVSGVAYALTTLTSGTTTATVTAVSPTVTQVTFNGNACTGTEPTFTCSGSMSYPGTANLVFSLTNPASVSVSDSNPHTGPCHVSNDTTTSTTLTSTVTSSGAGTCTITTTVSHA